ncbi:MAG: phosphatase, partial [Bacteroidota bacterium]
MRYFYLFLCALILPTLTSAQFTFDPTIEVDYTTTEVLVPSAPLKTQVLFIGGTDMVQTTRTYGNPATEVPAKEWHDFIGFTPDNESDDLGWVTVNHEMIQANDNIGDGGGMTVFKISRDPETDTIIIVEQTLNDGRQGKFFNVDFANTVGETGMNCGGIVGPDGRIWTAEEWFRTSNTSIIDNRGSVGVRDTFDYTITSDIKAANGQTVKAYENFNYPVEIDPRQAVAIRKQYN